MEPVSPGKVTVQRAGRPTAGVIAGGNKPGNVAREFLRGANAIEPCDPANFMRLRIPGNPLRECQTIDRDSGVQVKSCGVV